MGKLFSVPAIWCSRHASTAANMWVPLKGQRKGSPKSFLDVGQREHPRDWPRQEKPRVKKKKKKPCFQPCHLQAGSAGSRRGWESRKWKERVGVFSGPLLAAPKLHRGRRDPGSGGGLHSTASRSDTDSLRRTISLVPEGYWVPPRTTGRSQRFPASGSLLKPCPGGMQPAQSSATR